MNKLQTTVLELVEYQPTAVSPQDLPAALGEKLWRNFDQQGGKLLVEFPSPKTGQQWRLTAQGWVGTIPLSPTLTLSLQPKVPLHNLLGMWAYAYRLRGFQLLDGLVHVATLPEFYEQVAFWLAQGVMRRVRQGVYRAYLPREAELPFVRGQLVERQPTRPTASLLCRYDEQTADISHNQLLAYTLGQIARSGLCGQRVQTAVRRAYHTLQAITTPHTFTSSDCLGLFYNRLNQDYRLLHTLCRFFLEHSSPSHHLGDWPMHPFLVDMARLYELFVAEWLAVHLPPPWQLKAQETVHLGERNELRLAIDLVLYDAQGQARMVLDTKYKTPDRASTADFSQIVAYAKTRRCPEAVLIYPTLLPQPLHVHLDDLHVRSLAFALDSDLEAAGHAFLEALLPSFRRL